MESAATQCLILAGFFFIWKKGVLDWAHTERDESAPVRGRSPLRADLTEADLTEKALR